MSRIEELIEKLCPEGVEYRELGEVCEFKNGFAFKSSSFKDNGLPILRITNILSNGYIDTENFVYFDANEYKEDLQSFVVNAEDIVVAMSGATTGKIGINKTGKKLYLNQRVGKFIPNKSHLHNKYLYHWLLSQSVNIYNASSGVGAQPNLSSEKMKQFRIPIPPLEVQSEIVKVLDNFSELTAELTARKQQYEYYRNQLLTFDEDVELHKIKDIYKRIKGTPITAGKMKEIESDDGEIRIFAGGKTVINAKEEDIPNANITRVPAVLVQSRGVIDVIYYEKPFTFKNEMWAYTHNDKVSVKYLYYILKNNTHYLRESASGMGALPQISLTVTEDFKIPFPPIEKQREIVEILDNFSKLCEDISEGLPAEIEARQKQYEYYRDKLLTFKQKQ